MTTPTPTEALAAYLYETQDRDPHLPEPRWENAGSLKDRWIRQVNRIEEWQRVRLLRDLQVIQALDPDAAVALSPTTNSWYVTASIHVSDGDLIGVAGVGHRSTPNAAVAAYLAALKELGEGQVIVTGEYRGPRRHWRWNGAAWADASHVFAVSS